MTGVLLGILLVGAGLPGAAAERDRWVIRPLAPAKLRQLLVGESSSLADGSQLTSARILGSYIEATYRLRAGALVRVRLGHSSQVDAPNRRTRHFSLTLVPPPADAQAKRFMEALAANIRRHEKAWIWSKTVVVTPLPDPTIGTAKQPTAEGNQRLQWAVIIYCLMVLLAGLLLNAWVHWRGGTNASSRVKRSWDQWDLWAALVLGGCVVLMLWMVLSCPIHIDEANVLQETFWAHWFLDPNNGAEPPLPRFWQHLTMDLPAGIWGVRLPWVLGWGLCLWLVFRMLRERATGTLAFLFLAGLVGSGSFLMTDVGEAKLPLWVLSLLLAHRAFEAATVGKRRQWVAYALWTWLAMFTCYYTIAYAVGHFIYVLYCRRSQVKPLLGALAPTVLCALPFAYPVLTSSRYAAATSKNVSAPLGHQLLSAGIVLALSGCGLLLLWWRAWRGSAQTEESAGPPPGSRALPFLIVAGCLFPLLLMFTYPTGVKHYLPILPLGFLWLSGRPIPAAATLRRRQFWLTAAGALLLLLGGVAAVVWVYHQSRPTLWTRYREHVFSHDKRRDRGAVLVVIRGQHLGPIVCDLSGSLKRWQYRGPNRYGLTQYRVGGVALFGLKASPSVKQLESLVAHTGRFDLLRVDAPMSWLGPEVKAWISTHCIPLLKQRSLFANRTDVAYRCLRVGSRKDRP